MISKKQATAFVSEIFPIDMEKELLNFVESTVRLPRSKVINSEVGTHPDILLCDTGDDLFIGSPTLTALLSDYCSFLAGDELKDGYPGEVLYNCLFTKKHLFASKFSDKKILSYAALTGRETVIVKQGYTKCSVAVCGKESFITSDEGIYKALYNCGYNVLKISGKGIKLNGFSCGFIGGCCVNEGNGNMIFTGCLDSIPGGGSIRDFLKNIGMNVISLGNYSLYDFGGIIFVH